MAIPGRLVTTMKRNESSLEVAVHAFRKVGFRVVRRGRNMSDTKTPTKLIEQGGNKTTGVIRD